MKTFKIGSVTWLKAPRELAQDAHSRGSHAFTRTRTSTQFQPRFACLWFTYTIHRCGVVLMGASVLTITGVGL